MHSKRGHLLAMNYSSIHHAVLWEWEEIRKGMERMQEYALELSLAVLYVFLDSVFVCLASINHRAKIMVKVVYISLVIQLLQAYNIFQALNQPRARHQRTRDRLHVPCYAILCHFSCARLFMTPGTVARQAPLSMGFSRQEHWSGLPFPPLRDLPDPGIEPISHVSCIGRKVLYHQHHQACWNYSS